MDPLVRQKQHLTRSGHTCQCTWWRLCLVQHRAGVGVLEGLAAWEQRCRTPLLPTLRPGVAGDIAGWKQPPLFVAFDLNVPDRVVAVEAVGASLRVDGHNGHAILRAEGKVGARSKLPSDCIHRVLKPGFFGAAPLTCKEEDVLRAFIVLDIIVQGLPLVHSDQPLRIIKCELLPRQAAHMLRELIPSPMRRGLPPKLLRNVSRHKHRHFFCQHTVKFEVQVVVGRELLLGSHVAGGFLQLGKHPFPFFVHLI
mmetsp:Transcript_90206/g.125335  ORF Transcript_90206/g.125335 Transcript_90206/m.125335 type:complete len:253 (-) Transcript_90206:348-1106(-)